eukprot:gnl/TRDRNA2_/TRDRNA2_177981_c1_seq3.p1 gnl/TRDRNA2_/TRDRNA2_177981_c1~~gnl/TRDRNA2_/TRDRNA2_177981_c1_seq3.p1  ORF type:complete len:615 (+),score=-35.90 gnl/TRDRNA2_/TRDRNA2_177981_c1_seq3:81-1925(+)
MLKKTSKGYILKSMINSKYRIKSYSKLKKNEEKNARANINKNCFKKKIITNFALIQNYENFAKNFVLINNICKIYFKTNYLNRYTFHKRDQLKRVYKYLDRTTQKRINNMFKEINTENVLIRYRNLKIKKFQNIGTNLASSVIGSRLNHPTVNPDTLIESFDSISFNPKTAISTPAIFSKDFQRITSMTKKDNFFQEKNETLKINNFDSYEKFRKLLDFESTSKIKKQISYIIKKQVTKKYFKIDPLINALGLCKISKGETPFRSLILNSLVQILFKISRRVPHFALTILLVMISRFRSRLLHHKSLGKQTVCLSVMLLAIKLFPKNLIQFNVSTLLCILSDKFILNRSLLSISDWKKGMTLLNLCLSEIAAKGILIPQLLKHLLILFSWAASHTNNHLLLIFNLKLPHLIPIEKLIIKTSKIDHKIYHLNKSKFSLFYISYFSSSLVMLRRGSQLSKLNPSSSDLLFHFNLLLSEFAIDKRLSKVIRIKLVSLSVDLISWTHYCKIRRKLNKYKKASEIKNLCEFKIRKNIVSESILLPKKDQNLSLKKLEHKIENEKIRLARTLRFDMASIETVDASKHLKLNKSENTKAFVTKAFLEEERAAIKISRTATL